jgi:hypothetical protein
VSPLHGVPVYCQIDAPSSSTSAVEELNATDRGCASTDVSKTTASLSEMRLMRRIRDLMNRKCRGIGCSMLSHVSLAKIQIWLDFNRFHDTGCQILAIGLRMLNHLVQTQVLYLIASRLMCLSSMKF